MGKKGGVRQQLKRPAPIEFDHDVDGDQPCKAGRAYATGGRQRSKDIGEYLHSMFVIGRLSAPELQEGASASRASSGPGTRPSGSDASMVCDLAKAGACGK